jgi:transposase-like protein/VanZ family protein
MGVGRALPTWLSLFETTGLGQAGGMTPKPITFPGYRFPAEFISHALWLYHVFGLSLREVKLILAERGIGVSHESIRQWCLKFGGDIARKLRRRRPKPGNVWHPDEVYLRTNGVLHYLWRAVDQNGVALDILVQDRRNATAAKRFFKRLLGGMKYQPKRIVTDGLGSDGVARGPARSPTPDQPIGEQLRREFASADTTVRAADAALQVAWAGPEASLGACHDLRPLPFAAASHDHRPVLARPGRGFSGSGGRRRAPRGRRNPRHARPCVHSTQRQISWQCRWLCGVGFLLLVVLSLLSAEEMVRTGIGRYAEHALAYAGTGFLVSIAYRSSRQAAGALVAYAAALELLQGVSPSRHPALADWAASSAGALVGAGMAFAVVALWPAFQTAKPDLNMK